MPENPTPRFPVDVWSAKRCGLDSFLELDWPVADDEAQELTAAVNRSFLGAVAEAGASDRDLLLACYWMVGECWHVLHSRLLFSRLRDRGLRPMFSDVSPYMRQMAGAAPQLEVERPLRIPTSSRWVRLAAGAKAMQRSFRTRDPHLSVVHRRSSWPQTVSWGYPSSAQCAYIGSGGGSIGIIHPLAWASSRADLPPGRCASARLFCEAFVSGLEETAAGFGAGLSAPQGSLLRRIAAQWVEEIARAVTRFESLIPTGHSTVLGTSLGTAFFKAFSVACRRQGHTVVGFPHGHYGQIDNPVKSHSEFSVVDRYLAPTPRAAELFQRIADKYPVPGHRAEIEAAETKAFDGVFVGLQAEPVPAAIERVMFVGFPLAPHRWWAPYSYWAFQVGILVRAARLARQLGYRTILKRHPDRLAESEGLYDGVFDEQITDPFEQTYGLGDAFFFSDIGSSTFSFALMTTRPVIVPCSMLERVWDDLREPLSARCRVIDSRPSGGGGLELDEGQFRRALAAPPEATDNRFVEELLVSASRVAP